MLSKAEKLRNEVITYNPINVDYKKKTVKWNISKCSTQ